MLGWIFLRFSASILCLLPQQAFFAPPAKETSIASASAIVTALPTGEITLPFEYFERHIYVKVSVNDKPGLVFMLDTGATKNVLNLRTVRQLGIKPGSIQQQANIGFGNRRIYVAPEETVHAKIGSAEVADDMSVIDLSGLEWHLGHPLDGMLGFPFFQNYSVKVDFQKNLLSLFPAQQYSYRGAGFKVKLKGRRDLAIIPVTLLNDRKQSHHADVIVDSGSSVSLLLYKRFVHHLKLESSLSTAEAAKAYGLNGYYPIDVGDIYGIQVGDAEMDYLPVDYIEPKQEVVRSERNVVGAIGNGVLQGFQIVIFDISHRRLIFEVKR